MTHERRKETGSYYTPDQVARSLVHWVVRRPTDRLLDPSCGDGRFLQFHRRSVGVEQDAQAAAKAIERSPSSLVHEGEFFTWAGETRERFDCLAGNPPFIRYQRFAGEVRAKALRLCASLGASFSGLTSSWAPFLVAASSLLKPGGRMAFVVPAEIGHAPYAVPLLEYLIGHFDFVQVVPVQEKLFPGLSEDCWLLYAEGYTGAADFFKLTPITRFRPMRSPPTEGPRAGLAEWNKWNCRLRPFVLPSDIRAMYRAYVEDLKLPRLGSLAKVSIGYVTGDNDFFHLRPSEAQELQIPSRFLCPSVRNGRVLNGAAITQHNVDTWLENDEPVLLLRLHRDGRLPDAVQSYLETPAAQRARTGYKCRNRDPWYVVPDVTTPDGFLSYMSGMGASLVANDAKCVCTNSVHAVKMRDEVPIEYVQQRWKDPITVLSREIEGHPLGGGMLKLEPGEATNVILGCGRRIESRESKAIKDGIQLLRKWRHHG